MKRFEGKVAVVTGGARDLGRAVAVRLAAEGARVVVNYAHNEKNAQDTLEEIRKAGGEAIAVKAEVTREAEVKALFDEAVAAYGPKIDILVNVAGGMVA